jgi:hypothetical protein
MLERHGRPAHKLHYIDWVLGAIDVQLRLFNKVVENQPETDNPDRLRKIVDSLDALAHPEEETNE